VKKIKMMRLHLTLKIVTSEKILLKRKLIRDKETIQGKKRGQVKE
jgi:hypothetical protein